MPSEKWRTRTVAMWVRVFVRCEDPNSPATLFSHLTTLANQIGMTTAGLAEMGWKVAVDRVAVQAAKKPADGSAPRTRRLRAVPEAGTGA